MQPVTPEKLYDPAYIKQLFNEMSATYGLVNLISSFDFAWWWRRQCVRLAGLNEGGRVCDFMSGQGEARLLARYTRLFKNAKLAQAIFQAAGLHTHYTEFFFGCASAVCGRKP